MKSPETPTNQGRDQTFLILTPCSDVILAAQVAQFGHGHHLKNLWQFINRRGNSSR